MRPDDECPYPKPFSEYFDDCPAFQARQFIPLDTLYQPLEPVLTCRHLETRSMTQRHRWYGACALGSSDARSRWARQVGVARLDRIRAMQRELGAAIAPYTTRLWELKGQQLRAFRDSVDAGPATVELRRLAGKVTAICLPIIPPTSPPSGPPTTIAWLRVVLPVEPGETLHSKAKRVRGITVVARRKD